jgi:hypothetical protein
LWNPHDNLEQVSQPLVRKQPGAWRCFPGIQACHKLFSFQSITKQCLRRFFKLFAFRAATKSVAAAILNFGAFHLSGGLCSRIKLVHNLCDRQHSGRILIENDLFGESRTRREAAGIARGLRLRPHIF